MNKLILRSFYKETQNLLGIHYCDHGCGQIAKFYSTRKIWRCNFQTSHCPQLKRDFSKYKLGTKLSEETIKKLSKMRKGKNIGRRLSIETKQKISKYMSENPPFKGKHHTEETKKILSEKNKLNYFDCTGMKLSKEIREKISINQSRRIKNLNSGGMFKNVKYYKINNIDNKTYVVRGTWELKMAEFLNKNNILWEKKCYISYFKDGYIRHYVPDFYIPIYNKYIEVKGYFPEKDKEKMKLVLEQNKIKIEMAFEKDIKNLKLFLIKFIS